MLADLLHPLPTETADRYAQFIFGQLTLRANRPATLRHLHTLAGYETDYLVALRQLRDGGKHYFALATLSDEELRALDLDFELARQQALVAELESWELALLSVITGEATDDTLIGLERRVEACYYVG